MIYGKLPVVFLGVIASEKNGTTNSTIATYILNHIDEVRELGIKEIAEQCHVSVSSVSRFCKEIGLQDFVELKELLNSTDDNFETCLPNRSLRTRMEDYGKKVNCSIDMVTKTLPENKLTDLCQDLRRYEKTAAFGLLKAGCAAVNLQGDLWMMGKHIYTNISYDQQIEYIRQAGKDSLILIFSYTGAYFEYEKGKLFGGKDKREWPKIWMISGRQKAYPEYVTKVLEFQSPQDQTSHPYQLLYVAGLIAREFASQKQTQI